jgi:hypothetical protein
MTTRIYAVQGNDSFHLVEASTKNAALRHVAEKHFEVTVATQKTLVGAIQDGVQIEQAGEEPAPVAATPAATAKAQ